MTGRRRIWCELLEPEELGARATLELLDRYRLEPIVALPPSRETDAMGRALRALSDRGLRTGIWPLLADADGYWPSEKNVDRFIDRVHDALAFSARAGAKISTLAIDLEPPLEVSKKLLFGAFPTRVATLFAGAVKLADREERDAHRAAIDLFHALGLELARQQIETIAAALPMVVLDLASNAPLWQSVLRTPVEGPEWDVISPMLYTSLIAVQLPTKSLASARAILHASTKMLLDRVGPERASISIGLVGPGKLGDEPFLPSPEELANDVGAALDAGAGDLALFSLETALARGPEVWLDAFTETRACRPTGFQHATVSGLVRATAAMVRPLAFLRR